MYAASSCEDGDKPESNSVGNQRRIRIIDQIFPFLGVRFIAVNEQYDSKTANAALGVDMAMKNIMYVMYSRDLSNIFFAVVHMDDKTPHLHLSEIAAKQLLLI